MPKLSAKSAATPTRVDQVAGIDNVDAGVDLYTVSTLLGLTLASDVVALNISTAAYTTLQDLVTAGHSNGVISGGVITDGGAGTIDISAGEILIRSSNSATAAMYFAEFAAVTGQALTDNSINIIHVQYNAGAPVVRVGAQSNTDPHSNVVLGGVYRAGTSVFISNITVPASQAIQKLSLRLANTEGLTHASGSVTSEVGTLQISVTAGAWWLALNVYAASAINTSTGGTFSYWHQTSGTFTEVVTQNAISVTQYNDTTAGLAALSNNKYGVHWVYLSPATSTYDVVYGIGDYSLTEAQDALAPATLPPQMSAIQTALIAKIIVKKDAGVFTSVQNPYAVQFGQGIATNHNDLSNLAWTSSAHTGTATRVATFDGTGAAAEYTMSGTGTELALAQSPTLVTPALGTPSALVLTSATGLVNAGVAAGAAIDFSKLAALTATNLLVGNGSNVAVAVAMSGDATMDNAGAVTVASSHSGSAHHTKYLDSEAISAVEGEATLDLTGVVTIVNAVTPLDVKVTTDQVENQVGIFRGPDRVTPADADQMYVSFMLDDDNGLQSEFARLNVQAVDVTSTTKDGLISFSVQSNNVLVSGFKMQGNVVQFNADNADMNWRVDGGSTDNMIFMDAGLNVVSIGGAAVSGQVLTVYGLQAPDGDGTRDLGVQTTKQYANVWSDLINGAEISMENRWRMLESELYPGYPEGWALGHNHEQWRAGKSIWARHSDPEAPNGLSIGDKPPVFVVTDDFIEYQGRRITVEHLDKLLELIDA